MELSLAAVCTFNLLYADVCTPSVSSSWARTSCSDSTGDSRPAGDSGGMIPRLRRSSSRLSFILRCCSSSIWRSASSASSDSNVCQFLSVCAAAYQRTCTPCSETF